MFPGGHDPFEQMHRRMQAMHSRMFGDMMGPDPFFGAPPTHGQEGRQHHQRRAQGPTIEEVDDDHQHSHHEPTVEEPDDSPRRHRRRGKDKHTNDHKRQQQRSREQRPEQQQQYDHPPQQHHPFRHPMDDQLGFFGGHDPFAGMFGGGMFGGMFGGMPSMRDMMSMPNTNSGSSYSYSYSSSSTSGPNGLVYEETKTARRGPNGVMEEKSTVRDGRSGEERMRLTRGLGDRQRTLERRRNSGRDEERTETLNGIEHGHAEEFDRQWQQMAADARLGQFGGQGGGGRGNQRRVTPAQLGYGESGRYI